jgi:glycosyl transferase family 1
LLRFIKAMILIATPIPFDPPTEGNRMRVRALVDVLKAERIPFHVVFIRINGEDSTATGRFCGEGNFTIIHWRYPRWFLVKNRVKPFLQKLGISRRRLMNNALDDFCYRPALLHWQRLVRQFMPHTILIEYVFLSWLLKGVGPEVRKVIDTHDVFTERNWRTEQQGFNGQWFSLSRKDEAQGLNRADQIIAIQNEEARYFSEELRLHTKITTVGHLMKPCPLPAPGSSNVIGYLASANGNNIRSMEQFFEDVWPSILKQQPSLKMLVAGSFCDVFSRSLPGVEYLGRVGDVEDFYSRVSFAINPMLAGTGLKIKTLESLLHARPVIATPIASQGLESFDGEGLFTFPLGSLFGEAILSLASSLETCRNAADKCVAASQRYYSEHRKRFLSVIQNESPSAGKDGLPKNTSKAASQCA